MAKKKTTKKKKGEPKGEKLKQTRIPGTFDPPPKEVQDAADAYVEAKRQTAEWRASMNQHMEVLIDKMREHGVTEVEIDDGEKRILLVDAQKVQIKKREDKESEGAEDLEGTDEAA